MGYCSEHPVEALLLDIDGTLYPRRMLNMRMLRSMFPSIPLALAYQRMRRQYRVDQETVPTVPADLAGLRRRQAGIILHDEHRTDLRECDYERIERKLEKQLYDAWPRYFATIKPYEGMVAALTQAKDMGLRIGVLSDFPIADKLSTLGVSALVDVAVSAEQSGYLKPSPIAFEYLLSRMGIMPERALYVGDSYDKDILGAAGVGMAGCLIKPGYGIDGSHCNEAQLKYPKAALVVGSWPEFAQRVLRS